MQTLLAYPQTFVIHLQGHINAANAVDFEIQLTTAVAQEIHASVLVDLQQVESLDSAGLMALVSALKFAQQLNRRFVLCSVSRQIRIIFELTQLDRVFEIYESAAEFEATLA